MRPPLRFIHSADLHLDSLFKNKRHLPASLLEQLRESTFRAFDKLIEAAIKHEVDFILIVGDLYEEELRSLRAQVHLRDGFSRLEEHGIEVFISYGNHDYTNGTRYSIEFPDHVHVFPTEEVTCIPFEKNGVHQANLYGFSYENRHVTDRKVEDFRIEEGARYHIALLHGSLEKHADDHDVYAPFTLDEMSDKPMDYWALGHIHKREVLSEDPPIVYPGNIQGRSRKEQGEKGCYVVELHDATTSLTFIPLHTLTFEEITIESETIDTPDQLESILEQAKQEAERFTPVMLNVHLISSSGHLLRWQSQGILDEWISIVNDSEKNQENWVWIDEVHVSDQPLWSEEELKKGQHFAGALLREADGISGETLDEWLLPLLGHRKVSKHLSVWSEEEKHDILMEAKQLVIDKLMINEE